jgi:hypothetical protein
MSNMNGVIKILRSENPGNPGTQFYRGCGVLIELDGQTYGKFRQVRAQIRDEESRSPFSPSTVIKRAQDIGFVELRPAGRPPIQDVIEQEPPNSETAWQIKLDEPLQDANVFVSRGVDPMKPCIYVFIIEGQDTYVGICTEPSRYKREYAKNVRNLLAGLPYRPAKPNGFRRVHRALAKAIETDQQKISLVLIENWDDRFSGLSRETELKNAIGTLND